MRNFLRALRYSWKYRIRIVVSVLCALMAAGLWAANFGSIYPVLKILNGNKTLHEWSDGRVDALAADEIKLQESLAALRKHAAIVDGWPEARAKEREELDLSRRIAGVESQMDRVASSKWRHQQLKNYVIRFLPQDRFQTLACLLGMVLVLVVVKGVFEFWQEWLVGSVMTRTLYDIRNDFFRKCLKQDLRQVQENGSADLMTRFTNDTEQIGAGIKTIYGKVIAEPLRALACLIFAAFISWQLTLTFLVLVPVSIYFMTKTSRMIKRATRRMLDRMSSISKILQESFQGLRVVKAFTMEGYERRRFALATRDYANRSMQVTTVDSAAGPIMEFIGTLGVAIALLAGAYLVLNGKEKIFGVRMSNGPIELETLFQLYALLIGMADPVRKLSSVYNKIQNASSASDRVFAVLDKTPSVQSNPGGPRLGRHSGNIEFRDVCFSYAEGHPVLTNISFEVKAGETIAIVGSNGCGKSTLLNLLPRFYDPNHGSILVDGIDIREANLRSLRKQVGIVTQDTILFDDTIFNNIRYGNPRATEIEVYDAAKRAFAHEVALGLENGYDTLAGEAGKSLSGGQKQRISLARAILRNPSILILDEHTSQCDPVSEKLISDAMAEFHKGRTVFLITHKMATVENADRILVMDKGRLVAFGKHVELMATSIQYRRLVEANGNRWAA